MATAVQQRRGTDTQHDDGDGFTGLEGEITVDTTNDTIRVHDNSTKGGHRLAKYSELLASDTLAELNDTTINSPVAGQFLQWNGSAFINYTDLQAFNTVSNQNLVYGKEGTAQLELQNNKNQSNTPALSAASQEFTGAINFTGVVIDTNSGNSERTTNSARILSQFTNIRDDSDTGSVAGRLYLEVANAASSGWTQADSNPKNVMILEPDTVYVGVVGDPTNLEVVGTVTADAYTGSQTIANYVTDTAIDATEFASYAGKKIIYTGAASTISLPNVVAADIGKSWTIVNAGTGTITVDVDASGTAQQVRHAHAGGVNTSTTDRTIAIGGVVEIICIAEDDSGITNSSSKPNYLIYGGGVI